MQRQGWDWAFAWVDVSPHYTVNSDKQDGLSQAWRLCAISNEAA